MFANLAWGGDARRGQRRCREIPRRGGGCADYRYPSVRRIWERARAVTRRVAEETRTVDRRARRGETAANWVETRGAIWNDASLCDAGD